VAALPYTESLTSGERVSSLATALFHAGGRGGPPLRGVRPRHPIPSDSQPNNAMRGGMLSVRAGRRKCSQRHQWCQCVPATSARARGTHLASELKTYPFRQFITAGGHGSPPLRGIYQRHTITSTSQPNNAMRGGMLSARAGRRKYSHRRNWSQCVPATSARARGTHHASERIERSGMP
jgi:hypothetical protein